MKRNSKDAYETINIGEITKNRNSVIRIQLSSYYGTNHFVNMRVFVYSEDIADYLPTKEGLTFRVSEIDKVIELLKKAKDEYDKTNGKFNNKPTDGKKSKKTKRTKGG